jgi:hypothetical protein
MGRVTGAGTMQPCQDAHPEGRLHPALAAALISALSALSWAVVIVAAVSLL